MMYPYGLSHREWIAWCCYQAGMTYLQIAYSMGCTYYTVGGYLKQGRKKGAPLHFGLPSQSNPILESAA